MYLGEDRPASRVCTRSVDTCTLGSARPPATRRGLYPWGRRRDGVGGGGTPDGEATGLQIPAARARLFCVAQLPCVYSIGIRVSSDPAALP